MNVFPTLGIYEHQFRLLMESMEPGRTLIVNTADESLITLANLFAKHLDVIGYSTPEYHVIDGTWELKFDDSIYPLQVFGKHNMQNLVAASLACAGLGINQAEFFHSMRDFSGPARRLELLKENNHSAIYSDFAHAPSKVKATIEAAREQFPKRRLTAVLELHTYSSLNREFLEQYRGTANEADMFIVFLNAHAMVQKGLQVTAQDVSSAFGRSDAIIITSASQIKDHLDLPLQDATLLLMSSGNFDGLDLKALANLAIN
jgi:UDP-N-acetylmuramate: L-alanyl-gamma-D-glutamyl-meso-diaminopimelate ligase